MLKLSSFSWLIASNVNSSHSVLKLPLLLVLLILLGVQPSTICLGLLILFLGLLLSDMIRTFLVI